MPTKRPLTRFNEIIYHADLIQRDTKGMDEAAFRADDKTQRAALYSLLAISEASKKLGSTAEQVAPSQPWQSIRDLGNVLRHEYEDIHLDKIWNVITTRLDPLRTACQEGIRTIHRGLDRDDGRENER